VDTQRSALAAAQRLGEPEMQADSHRDLAHALARPDELDQARAHFGHALTIYEALGNLVGQAHVERGIGFTYTPRGPYEATLRHCERAGQLYQAAGSRIGWAKALNETG
jgi:tetratricopeptide (TPR) repeat protein